MSSSLQEQLLKVGIPHLTTILRTTLMVNGGAYSQELASEIVLKWINEKARPYRTAVPIDGIDFSFSQDNFRIEAFRTDASFAITLEEPDATTNGRSWLCDIALTTENSQCFLALRLGFRDLERSGSRPNSRAPRFLRDVVEQIGGFDYTALAKDVAVVDGDSVPFLQDLIASNERTLPVILISESAEGESALGDNLPLARTLAGTAHIYRISSDASWAISKSWGKEWSTFQGAIRYYAPRFDLNGDKFSHRLWKREFIERADATSRQGFINAACAHVFAQLTAQFEAIPLPSPILLRKLQAEAAKAKIEPIQEQSVDCIPERNVGTADSPPARDENPDESAADDLKKELQVQQWEIESLNALLEDERTGRLEAEAKREEERTSRAESERALEDAKSEYVLLKDEYDSLNTQHHLAMGDSATEKSKALVPLWDSFSSFVGSIQNLAVQFRRMEEEAGTAERLRLELLEEKQTVANLRATISSLERRQTPDSSSLEESHEEGQLSLLIPDLVRKDTPLHLLLRAVELSFPKRIVVLKSAYDSAEGLSKFRHREEAFELLWLLATDYWSGVDGVGDSCARSVFGKQFASKESENLSKKGRDRRTFSFEGGPLVMERHLKLGVADSPAETLRIHFEWLASRKVIVIGHCGEHLPL